MLAQVFYSVHSGYWISWELRPGAHIGGTSNRTGQTWWCQIGKLKIPDKIKLFMLRASSRVIVSSIEKEDYYF